jgi:exportin-T
MLAALVQSGISAYPHRTVAMQFFETVARYSDFFKVRKEYIMPTLEAMVDTRYIRHFVALSSNAHPHHRGLHNQYSTFRSRLSYLFYRFIKENKSDISLDIAADIIGSIRDLLPIEARIPELEDPELDILSEAVKNSVFDSQLYLYEAAAILCSLLSKSPEQQAALLLSLVEPLLDELSVSLQAFTKGDQDLVPIVKAHHAIMALGNIAKGFPDYPSPLPEGYISPPLDVFGQVAQAILLCLEVMNVFKVVRDAVRYFSTTQSPCLIFRLDQICFCPNSGYHWS